MLRKLSALFCVAVLSVGFVGCNATDTTVEDAADSAAQATGEAAEAAVEAADATAEEVSDAAESAADAVESAATGSN